MDAQALTVLDAALPRGRRIATSVPDLARWLNMSDREIRQGLEQLVNDRRVAVVTLPVKRGVFVATNQAEVALADEQLRSRAMALLRRRRSLRMAGEALAYTGRLF
jgi:ABC-type transporter Mla subunit MlaD